MQNTTPSELAEVVHSDPKTVRKFLRSMTPRDEQPGRGNRWAIPGGKRNMTRLQKQFDEWADKHTNRPHTA